jgi:Ala-tRNA(Pro) deacylase
MPATPEDLFALLDRLGIAHETQHHPAVFTVEESKTLRGKLLGAHVKNLFLKDKKGRFFLITALENAAIDLKTIHQEIGGQGRVSFGSAEQLMERLGVEPGSVTPFSLMNDGEKAVTFILDGRLMDYDRINAHPLRNTMTTGVSRTDLFRFFAETGHEPMLIAFPARDHVDA